MSTATRKLSTAEIRREELIDAAVPVFAERGYHASSTAEIAKAAGISQAYLFRLFPTKPELFAAVCGIARERMLAAMRAGAERGRAEGIPALEAMGAAYEELVENDRDTLLVQLQSNVAASREPLIRDEVQQTFRELYALVSRESGATPIELQVWFSMGMLINVMAAIGAEDLDEQWAQTLTGHHDC
jgi:AcrR family transcriptional regulator